MLCRSVGPAASTSERLLRVKSELSVGDYEEDLSPTGGGLSSPSLQSRRLVACLSIVTSSESDHNCQRRACGFCAKLGSP